MEIFGQDRRTMRIIAECIMINMIHYKVNGSSVPVHVGCIKVVKYM